MVPQIIAQTFNTMLKHLFYKQKLFHEIPLLYEQNV